MFLGNVVVELGREIIITTLKFCYGEVQPIEVETYFL